MTDDINYRIAAATRDEYVKQVARARVAYDNALIAEAAGKISDVAAAKQRLTFCETEARKWAKFATALKTKDAAIRESTTRLGNLVVTRYADDDDALKDFEDA